MAGNAVVDRDDQRRLVLARQAHDLRCQAIAVLKAIRHQEIDRCETEPTQLPHHQRGAGRTVSIEIADHDDRAALGEVSAQQLHPAGMPSRRPTGTS
jgi:hypothetical protein